jgi:hypothetical protein
MRILPTARQFFDLSFIAYSKEFAAEFGLVDSLIEKLEPGFHYVQLKAATTGSGTKCTATLVLDKDLTSALGSEDRFSSMLVSVELPFTDKSEPPVLRTPQQESAAKSLNRFAGQPLYEFNRFISLRGATAELNAKSNLDYYLASRSERMNVISLSGWCEYWLPTLSDSSARFVVSGSATGAEHFVTIPDRLRNGIFSSLEGKQLTY